MIWISLALCFSGFVALCLSVDRHHEQVLGKRPPVAVRQTLRLAGWLALLAASAPCINLLGISIGLALWAALLSIAALGQVLLLTYAPRLIVPLAFGAPSLTLPLLLF